MLGRLLVAFIVLACICGPLVAVILRERAAEQGMLAWLAVAIVVVVYVGVPGVGLMLEKRSKNHRRQRFACREAVPFENWYQSYCDDVDRFSAVHVLEILKIVSYWIGVEATQLRPTDRLQEDFGLTEPHVLLDESWSIWRGELERYARRLAGCKLSFDPEWATLDDLIRGVLSQISP